MRQLFLSLQAQTEFRKLWFGNLISTFGTRITGLALPLTAIVALQASVTQIGILAAAGTLPNLLFGLPAGVFADRLPRRLILVFADAGRALLMASIPAAALLDVLRIEQLYVVAFLATTLDLFFDVASTSLVPVILGREHLTDGNTALSINNQVGKLAGPSLAGVLIGILTAPVAIILDAISYLISAICSTAVRVVEPALSNPTKRSGWWADIGEGLQLVWRDHILRSIVGASVLGSLAGAVQATALMILFLTREIGLSPTQLGFVLAVSGAASIPGSLLARAVAGRVGQGRATAIGTAFVSLGMLLIPLVGGPIPLTLALLVTAQLLIGIGIPIYGINQQTVRQLAVPNHLRGRANATRRFLMLGGAPFGAVISGSLGQIIGLRLTFLAGALLMVLALLWTVRSPLWSLRDVAPAEGIAVQR